MSEVDRTFIYRRSAQLAKEGFGEIEQSPLQGYVALEIPQELDPKYTNIEISYYGLGTGFVTLYSPAVSSRAQIEALMLLLRQGEAAQIAIDQQELGDLLLVSFEGKVREAQRSRRFSLIKSYGARSMITDLYLYGERGWEKQEKVKSIFSSRNQRKRRR